MKKSITPTIRHLSQTAGILVLFSLQNACTPTDNPMKYNELIEQSLLELRTVLTTQEEWVKVHAAEYLLWAGYPEGVLQEYLKEAEEHQTKPQYRIGIWRVLAQADPAPENRKQWTDTILNAFLDTGGPDRIHAAETLAKLKVSPAVTAPEITRQTLESEVNSLVRYTQWSISYTSPDSLEAFRDRFIGIVTDPEADASDRRLAAYALGRSGKLPLSTWKQLAQAALDEAPDAGLFLLSAALQTAPEEEIPGEIYTGLRAKLRPYQQVKEKGVRSELAMALARAGDETDIPLLESLLYTEDPIGKEADDADVRAAAAYALLQLIERVTDNR